MKVALALCPAILLLSAVLGYATRAQTPPDATEAIAKQIGWLVI